MHTIGIQFFKLREIKPKGRIQQIVTAEIKMYIS